MGRPIRLRFCGMPFRHCLLMQRGLLWHSKLFMTWSNLSIFTPHCACLHHLLRPLGLCLITFSLAPSPSSTATFWTKVILSLNLCIYPFPQAIGLCSNTIFLVRSYFFYFCVFLFIISLPLLNASFMRVWAYAV